MSVPSHGSGCRDLSGVVQLTDLYPVVGTGLHDEQGVQIGARFQGGGTPGIDFSVDVNDAFALIPKQGMTSAMTEASKVI